MLHPIDLLHAQTLISLIQFGLDPVGFLAAVGAAAFRRALPQALSRDLLGIRTSRRDFARD